MTLLITFALANFPLTFTILCLIVAGVEILRKGAELHFSNSLYPAVQPLQRRPPP
jgi:hypothetical protein